MFRQLVRRTLTLAHAGLAALIGGLIILSPVGAHALGDQLEFSTDGTSWSSLPPDSLFDTGVVLVPGDSATATLHLRSIAPTPGALGVALTDVRSAGPDAARHFGVSAMVDAESGGEASEIGMPRISFAELAAHSWAGPQIILEPGQSVEIVLTVDFAHRSGSTGGRNSSVNLSLAVSFADARGPHGGGSGDDAESAPVHVAIPLSPSGDGEGSSSAPVAETGTGMPRLLPAEEPTAADHYGRVLGVPGLLARTGIDLRGMLLVTLAIIVAGSLLYTACREREEP